MLMNGKSCLIPILMRYVVLRNKIMPFVCVGEIITNVLAHIFSAALEWCTPGVDAIISGLRTRIDAHQRLRH